MLVGRIGLDHNRRESGLVDSIRETLSLKAQPLMLGVDRLILSIDTVEEVTRVELNSRSCSEDRECAPRLGITKGGSKLRAVGGHTVLDEELSL